MKSLPIKTISTTLRSFVALASDFYKIKIKEEFSVVKKTTTITFVLVCFISIFFIFSLFIIHIQIKTTLLGYEIGKIRFHENSLVKKISLLEMKLAQLTSKKKLQDLLKRSRKKNARKPKKQKQLF